MRRAKGNESRDFVAAIKRDLSQRPAGPRGNAHIDRGLYFSQIERVFSLFPREQVLILKYDDLRANHSAIVDLMFDFIGLPQMPAIENERRNVGPYDRKMTDEERAYVSQFFDEDITKLEALLGWDCSAWRFHSHDPPTNVRHDPTATATSRTDHII